MDRIVSNTLRALPALLLCAIVACADPGQQANSIVSPSSPRKNQQSPAVGSQLRDTIAPDRYIVVLKDGSRGGKALARELAQQFGRKLHLQFEYGINGFSADIPPQALEELRRHPGVMYVEKDRPVHVAEGGTDYNAGWAVGRIDQRDLPSDGVFTYGTTGDGVNIYIVDTGVDPNHPELAGRVLNGWSAQVGSATQPCHTHGTSVASVAAGTDFGVAKEATIWAVRGTQCENWAWVSEWVSALDWVTANHVKPAILNFSVSVENTWDDLSPGSLENAVQRAYNAGVLTIVSAGNGNNNACNISPARNPAAITAGAIDTQDVKATFSSWGPCVDVWAPGVDVPVAIMGGGSGTNSGTSFSAPMVAGVAALLMEKYPNMSVPEVRRQIIEGATQKQVLYGQTVAPVGVLYSNLPSPVRAGEIVGPDVAPGRASCSWTINGYRAGLAPFTYTWSGVLSGTGMTVVGTPAASGYLQVEVQDALGTRSSSVKYITLDPYSSSEEGC